MKTSFYVDPKDPMNVPGTESVYADVKGDDPPAFVIYIGWRPVSLYMACIS